MSTDVGYATVLRTFRTVSGEPATGDTRRSGASDSRDILQRYERGAYRRQMQVLDVARQHENDSTLHYR